MIIPQIAENLSAKTRAVGEKRIEIPATCPACAGETAIQDENGTRTLICTNPYCSAKKLKLFSHFVSRNAMNIDGFSEASIEKFNITEGYIYFATDSGKVYLDTATERIVAGGSGASVLYANAKDVQQELINFSYILRLTDLEDKNANPKKDDLIINSNG
jgi:hypothetical protein